MKFLKFIIQLISIALTVIRYGGITLISTKRRQVNFFPDTARLWGQAVLNIAGVKVEVSGLNLLDVNENYVFVSNHLSLFDIPILQSSLPFNFRIVYKQELEKIPFFGYVLAKSPYIGIVREDSKDALKGMRQALGEFQKGASILIFPEGTRSKDGNLQEFKRGAFMLASKSQKTIVPITIIGSNLILPKGKRYFSSGIVKVIIDKPILPPENSNKKSEIELQNKIYEIIKINLEKHKG